MSSIYTSTHVRKIASYNCVNSFIENKFVVPIQKLGKLLLTKESVEHMYYVWRERKYSSRYDKFSGPQYADHILVQTQKNIPIHVPFLVCFLLRVFFFCQQTVP
jgi:hypothetical protein